MFRIFFIVLIICFSCSKESTAIIPIKPDRFIEKPGKYLLGSKQIWLKEFTDGTIIFEIGDNLNRKTLYQQSIFRAFSKYHNWIMYIDEGENIWCYNGDLKDHFVLLYEDVSGCYKEIDYLRQIIYHHYLSVKKLNNKKRPANIFCRPLLQ